MSKPAEYGQVSPTQPSDQQSAAPHWTGRGAGGCGKDAGLWELPRGRGGGGGAGGGRAGAQLLHEGVAGWP